MSFSLGRGDGEEFSVWSPAVGDEINALLNQDTERLALPLFPDPTGAPHNLNDPFRRSAHRCNSAGRAGDDNFFGHQRCSHSFAKTPSICGFTRLPRSSML